MHKPLAFSAVVLLVFSFKGVNAAAQQPPPPSPVTASPIYSYALAGGDKIRIVVYGEETLTSEYIISSAGLISLPLIGDVTAQGLTASQLQALVTQKLAAGYINEPRVAVQVLTTRPFYILGEVNHPGEYPYTDGLSVAAAVARAGGYTYRAKTKMVMIQHVGGQATTRYVAAGGTLIAPGDVVRVPERWF